MEINVDTHVETLITVLFFGFTRVYLCGLFFNFRVNKINQDIIQGNKNSDFFFERINLERKNNEIRLYYAFFCNAGFLGYKLNLGFLTEKGRYIFPNLRFKFGVRPIKTA